MTWYLKDDHSEFSEVRKESGKGQEILRQVHVVCLNPVPASLSVTSLQEDSSSAVSETRTSVHIRWID